MAPVASILNQFSQIRMHFKAENLFCPIMYNLWGSMAIYLWIAKLVIHRSFFFQNALVDHIGVCTDTNNNGMSSKISPCVQFQDYLYPSPSSATFLLIWCAMSWCQWVEDSWSYFRKLDRKLYCCKIFSRPIN